MRLQLTDGYYLHFDIFSAILKYCFENLLTKRITILDLVNALGYSKKAVMASTKIMVETGLLNNNSLTITEFGNFVAKYDLFFENNSTLWICHYNISSNTENYVWYRFVNKILPFVNNYKKQDFYKHYEDIVEINKGKSAIKSMHKEVVSLINAYSFQQFKNLRLLFLDHEGKYQKDNPVEIEPLVFLYCLLAFKEMKNINATALTVSEIINDNDTPTKIFHLEEPKVHYIIHSLHSKQLVGLEKFGELNQIRFPNYLRKEFVLNKIYGVNE